MTLHLASIGRWGVCHVSDRRLTTQSRGLVRPWDEWANKNVVFHANDGLLSIGYAGLAHIDGVDSDQWIAEQIVGRFLSETSGLTFNLGEDDWPSVGQAQQRLRDAITDRWRRKGDIHRAGLAVHFAGFQWSRSRARKLRDGIYQDITRNDPCPDGSAVLVFASDPIPNAKIDFGCVRHIWWQLECGPSGIRESSLPRWWRWDHEGQLLHAGQHVEPDLLRGLVLRLSSGASPCTEEAAHDMVQVIRRVAAVNAAVGKDCVSVQLHALNPPHVVLRYHPCGRAISETARRGLIAFTPWILTRGIIQRPQEFSGSLMLGIGRLRLLLLGPVPHESGLLWGTQDQRRMSPPRGGR